MTGHYTAVLEVTHTEEAEVKPGNSSSSRQYNSTAVETKPRKKRDIARIVVRADSMDKLQERLTAHVALIEDDSNQPTASAAPEKEGF